MIWDSNFKYCSFVAHIRGPFSRLGPGPKNPSILPLSNEKIGSGRRSFYKPGIRKRRRWEGGIGKGLDPNSLSVIAGWGGSRWEGCCCREEIAPSTGREGGERGGIWERRKEREEGRGVVA